MAAASRCDAVLRHRLAKPLVWLLCLLPLAGLVWGAATGGLGANPAEALLRRSGDWTLRLLCVALAVTPVRLLLGWPALARFRRLLGLFAFFYAVLHLLCWAWLDQGLDAAAMAHDVVQRPFILVGVATFVLLLALAATSPAAAVRRLGARRWRRLHRCVYLAVLLALLHFFWMRAGKRDWAEVQVYGAVVAALLLARLLPWVRRR
ncbi:hypothetical protein GCM10022279_26900 [Comamonas faecalis]|uniref:Protein-methionine-sulfoxide reductase heme-binding subunit MsrQ n=1 Tax=Comamonas faecalis TaxID=1387849 RepID=A0ABP7RT60_9BURK